MKYLELKKHLGGAKFSPSGLTDPSVNPSTIQAPLKRAKIGDVIIDEENDILGTIVKDNDKFWLLNNGGSVNKDNENIDFFVTQKINTSEDNIIDNDKLFQVLGKAEMINYWYFWGIFDDTTFEPKPIKDEFENDIIYMINTKTFPLNHLQKDQLDFKKKKELLEDEYFIIKNDNPNITLLQIPRVIYDLIAYEYITTHSSIKIEVYLENINTFEQLKKHILKLIFNSDFYNLTKEINNLIITKYIKPNMVKILKDSTQNHFGVYLEILENILTEIYTKTTGNISKLTGNFGRPEPINKITNPRFAIIIKQVLYIECGYIYDIDSHSYIINTAKNKFLLFRGDTGIAESTIYQISIMSNRTEKFPIKSLSYNTSLLSGIFYEVVNCEHGGACTLEYYAKGNSKKYYLLDKFFLDDCSTNDKIFHIPPLHPILCLSGKGETWHPRTRIPQDFMVTPNLGGIPVSGLGLGEIPSYLMAKIKNQEDFEKEYQDLLVKTRKTFINKTFIKYLKYASLS